jgi:HJR/Mrr/RecB family endonuclease
MARRRKDDDWIALVAQLGGLVVLLSLISPQARQAISAFGVLAFCLLGLIVVGLIGFCVYRLVTRSQRTNAVERNVEWKTLDGATNVPSAANSPFVGVSTTMRWDAECQEPKTAPDLIGQLRSIDWFQFEKVVALLYRKLGYTVTSRGGANPDGGIDLVIEKDGQRSAVQCKQWKSWNIGVKTVREFLGALTDAQIQKGIFVTLCGYTGEAKQLADKHGIEIVNGKGLAGMIESAGISSDPEALALLHDTKKFCPKCENGMVLRTAKKGTGAGRQFWGCSTYPKCRFTMPG